MTSPGDPRLISSLKLFSKVASAIVIFIGGLVLLGWILNIGVLKSIFPGLVTMKSNTALAFILSATSLWLLNAEQMEQWRRRLAQMCALAVALVGLLTLTEYLSGWDLVIDQLLFHEEIGTVGTFSPGRMAPNTALNFLLLGLALLFLDRETRYGHRPVQFLTITVSLVGLLALLGYAYGVTAFYGIASYTQMALHTAVGFIVLSVGVLFVRPDRGLMAVVTSDRTGGIMARRLLLAAIGIPVVLGWLRLAGQRAGLYDAEFGMVLVMVLTGVGFMVLIGWNARTLNQTDAERKRAEEELTKQTRILKSVLASIGEGVVVADQDGKFLIWNPAAEQIVNLGPLDVPPGEWSERYGVYLPDQVTPYPADRLPLARAIRGESVDRDEQFLRHAKAPQGIWLSVTGRPLIDESGVLRGGVVVFSDITERKRTDESLKNYAAQLEAVNKELEAFSYSVSHDLRAPLRHVDGFSQILLEDYAEKLDEPGQRYLQQVREASQHMAQLIDDMLNLSRITRVDLRREVADLTRMAKAATEALQKTQPDRTVEFVIEDGLMVEGDARLLRVLLDNLLGNAWKYTGKRPQARIEFGRTARDGKAVYFVRDNGAGFDMAYAHKLFGAFQRLHTVSEFPGTGIGLATVQRIVHRHGGQVWAEGAVDQGATFYFTL